MDKINEVVMHELSREIAQRFPTEILSVTKVEVSKDLSFAKVWISALSDAEKWAEACQQQAAEMTQVLAKKMETRTVPRLRFVPDTTEVHADRIDQLLKEIKNEKR